MLFRSNAYVTLDSVVPTAKILAALIIVVVMENVLTINVFAIMITRDLIVPLKNVTKIYAHPSNTCLMFSDCTGDLINIILTKGALKAE